MERLVASSASLQATSSGGGDEVAWLAAEVARLQAEVARLQRELARVEA